MSNHFDPLDILYSHMLRESYTKDTEELIRWLSDNHYYHNTRAFDEASSQAAIKWKDSILQSLGTIIQSSATWITNQLPGDTDIINQNMAIISDPNRYPIKLPPAQGAPAFARALQRLSTPISSALRGYDIGKIEDDANANLAFKKTITPTYDGKSDYTQFCKLYFGGNLPADRTNYQPQQLAGIIKMAQQFCTSIKTRFNTMKQDCDQVINFINSSSTGSISNQLRTDQAKLNQMQQTAGANRAAGMASTQPGANAGTTNPVRPVNADTSYEYFMEEYFAEATPGQPQPATQSANPKPVNTSTPSTPTSNSNKTADSLRAEKMPNGAGIAVDPNKLAERKRQVMAEICRQVMAAKVSAMLGLYSGLMGIIKMHISSYGGNIGQPVRQQQVVPNQVQQ